jgi:hypothetical protein
MYDDDRPMSASAPPPPDERVEALERLVGLEQAERQAQERAKEMSEKHAAIRDDLDKARHVFLETLRTRGLLPRTGNVERDPLDPIRRLAQ